MPPTIGATCARPRRSPVLVNTSYDASFEGSKPASELEYLKQQLAAKDAQLLEQKAQLIDKDKQMQQMKRNSACIGVIALIGVFWRFKVLFNL